jgi:hypothetical protein
LSFVARNLQTCNIQTFKPFARFAVEAFAVGRRSSVVGRRSSVVGRNLQPSNLQTLPWHASCFIPRHTHTDNQTTGATGDKNRGTRVALVLSVNYLQAAGGTEPMAN